MSIFLTSRVYSKIWFELNSPEDLYLPSRSREVLVKTYKKVNLDDLESILINNNRTIKIYLEKVEQAKSILKSSLSLWYPTLNLTANGIPQYFESNNYNQLMDYLLKEDLKENNLFGWIRSLLFPRKGD